MSKIIAIDPDVEKSGVAYINLQNELILFTPSFFDLFNYLQFCKKDLVLIEASWLISHNWTGKGLKASVVASIANRTGANHETGRKIVEMCNYLNIEHKLIKPLKKIWKSKDGKISHEELAKLCKSNKIIFNYKKSNQDQRDAALIAINYRK